MKKFLLACIFIVAMSCVVEEEDHTPCDPACGEVIRRGFASEVANKYVLIIRNECSGRTKDFDVDREQYYNFDKGDYVCSIDGTSWKSGKLKK